MRRISSELGRNLLDVDLDRKIEFLSFLSKTVLLRQ